MNTPCTDRLLSAYNKSSDTFQVLLGVFTLEVNLEVNLEELRTSKF